MTQAQVLLKQFSEMLGRDFTREFTGGTDICICPECSMELPHERGIPCIEQLCPNCKIPMTGKDTVGSQSK